MPMTGAEPSDSLPLRSALWRDLPRALRNQPHDHTTGSLSRGIVLLAVPMTLELLMEAAFALVNMLWVARLGRDAVAVVGLTESVMALIQTTAVGMAVATTAHVARRVGANDLENAARAVGQIMILGIALSVGLGLLLAQFAVEILALMGATPSVIAQGQDYARTMLGWNITLFMIFLINAAFRGAGDAILAMRTLWLANFINAVLAPCFIFGWGPAPEMGVSGAALATNLGRGAGVAYQLWHLTGRNGRLRLCWRHLLPASSLLRGIMVTAARAISQQIVITTSWVALIRILAVFGSGALAGYTVAIRIAMAATMLVAGIANAGATLVGQNLGAGRPERAEAAIRLATRISTLSLGVVGALFVIFSRPIVMLFTGDPEVLHYGSRALWIVSLAFPLYAAGACFSAAFNGAGDTRTPLWLNLCCFWFGQIPLAWLLSNPLALGPTGVFIAVPFCFSIAALWSGLLFKRGRWKLHTI